MRHSEHRLPLRRMLPAAALIVFAALTGCTGTSASPPQSANAAPETTAPATVQDFDQTLHDELIAMLERDQLDRTGGSSGESDQARTDRLKEIIAEHGWPTIALVGKDGEDAAWAIAQHSDLDPEFQREALELLRQAVDVDQASPGNLAYLEDRVAVAAGEPQRYGTQVACTPDGPKPATPIADPSGLDGRRAVAGLQSYAAYIEEMTAICAAPE
jgi:hypothetical protein